jgi:hypothetical protein
MSRGGRLLASAVMAGFGIVVAVLMLEIGVRVMHLVPDRFWEPDPLLGTRLIPGRSGWWTQEEHEFVVPVRINDQGRRDLDRSEQKTAGTFRILLLGDSFVEAMHVPIENTFARRLEGLFANQGPAPVEVVSMGVSGYGTAGEYLYYRDIGRRFHPDLVVLSFYPGNDVRNNSPTLEPALPPTYDANGNLERVTAAKTGDGTRRGWLASSEAYTFVRKLILTRQPWLAERLASWGLLSKAALRQVPMADGVPVDYLVYAQPPPREWETAWQHTEGLLTALRDAVAADGARFMVMIVTAREQIYDADWQALLATYPAMQRRSWDLNGPERRVLDWCARSGVSCVQLSRAFAARRGDGTRLHFIHDGHWTPAGHALAAQAMYDVLREAGWPSAHLAEGS